MIFPKHVRIFNKPEKPDWKKPGLVIFSLITAIVIGWFQGSGVEKLVAEETLRSLINGDFKGFMAYAGIFFLIWYQVRGLKSELQKMNENISSSLTAGELRFEKIEHEIQSFEHRLTVLEQQMN